MLSSQKTIEASRSVCASDAQEIKRMLHAYSEIQNAFTIRSYHVALDVVAEQGDLRELFEISIEPFVTLSKQKRRNDLHRARDILNSNGVEMYMSVTLEHPNEDEDDE